MENKFFKRTIYCLLIHHTLCYTKMVVLRSGKVLRCLDGAKKMSAIHRYLRKHRAPSRMVKALARRARDPAQTKEQWRATTYELLGRWVTGSPTTYFMTAVQASPICLGFMQTRDGNECSFFGQVICSHVGDYWNIRSRPIDTHQSSCECYYNPKEPRDIKEFIEQIQKNKAQLLL